MNLFFFLVVPVGAAVVAFYFFKRKRQSNHQLGLGLKGRNYLIPFQLPNKPRPQSSQLGAHLPSVSNRQERDPSIRSSWEPQRPPNATPTSRAPNVNVDFEGNGVISKLPSEKIPVRRQIPPSLPTRAVPSISPAHVISLETSPTSSVEVEEQKLAINQADQTQSEEPHQDLQPRLEDALKKIMSKKTEPLPRYTSGDAMSFNNFNPRMSLKQDNSYHRRLESSYQAPPIIPRFRNDIQ
ncbi:hypothetical protein O181_034778 [Austropuccinia psidii MF-1]|uniref:Uncharacterized protein n=1 Tax=Austropuccinia psidii MF-1 TaxID=1389203 RepID=A0A9Q3D462_9BASI|nr:hypothetical protein [Austropuccinia psidii MF-1]